jgi:carnitine-CoA ligase
MGRTALTTAALWSGARSVLRPTFSVSGFWDDVRSVGATVFGYLGSVVHLLHEQPPRPDDADNPLRVGFGAAAPPEIVENFERRFDLTLLENYGSTELGVPSYSVPGNVRRGTMGTINPCLEVAIHDDDDRPVAHGERGEIVVRPREPSCMMLGYWRQPEATLHAFRNLWFHTGDLGTLTDDGFLTYVDRTKDVIRRRGENISSFEVERAVNAHPNVLECAAYALPSEITEDEVAVAVVAQPDSPVDLEALVRWCVETMPRFAVPRYVRVVPELPKTPSQRVEKYKLRAEGVTADTFDREVAGIVVPRS